MTGDGLHAAFTDPLDALNAALNLQQALAVAQADGVELRVRCGVHAGPSEGRDNDFYGTVVNRAARIMGAAHGGQILVSQVVADLVASRLPPAVTLRDLGLVRLRDLASPERLHQLLAPCMRSDFPVLRSLEGTPNNLPQALSSFVGRARDITEVRKLLQQHRLVTLVGMGGFGKTRLSLHVGAESLEEYRDGVWLVELGPLQEAPRVGLAVASTLGVKEEGGRPIEEALARHVKDRALLVILDNCEHLVESAAAVARLLLSSGAKVRVLATSREPLHIAGESTHVVAGLTVPGPREALVAESAGQFEAVRLFVDRAAAASPGFTLNAENVTSVAAICNRLDGIPLAIELAAARARSISVAQIATRVKDRFRLLTAGDPTALPRQRTLRAMIDWSHDLLPETERVMFRRLAVFTGTWTLDAAEFVCAGDLVRADAVLDLISRLVEKSLVGFDEPSQRYRMLETVHEYAVERLVASDDAAAVGDRHLDFFVALATLAKPRLAGPERRATLASLDAERENILSAHEWAGRSPRFAAQGLKLVDAVKLYWAHRGLLELGHRLTAEALARPGAQETSSLRAGVMFNLGQFRYFMGRYAEARESLEASVRMARELEDSHILGGALQTLGLVAIGQDDLASARPWLEEAVTVLAAGGDKRWLAGAVNALAMLLRVEGEFAGAKPLYQQAVELARESGDREAESVGLLNLAMLCLEGGDAAGGRFMLSAALAIAAETSSSHARQSGLEVCAGLAADEQEWQRAARFYGAAESSSAVTGARRDTTDEKFLAPRIARARRALGEREFAAASGEGTKLSLERASEEARAWLSAVAAVRPA
ncbi:MAG TPA: tetratricopeptide repeat protein, partial [Usitatibacter sp.]|nr:tetratricopeptide repeat protein [Usitatibacter sp.]